MNDMLAILKTAVSYKQNINEWYASNFKNSGLHGFISKCNKWSARC